MRWFILWCIIVLVVSMPVLAEDWFVDESKTGGDNTGADTTHAWLLLDNAMQQSFSAGDTIFVRGTHDETLSSNIEPVSDGTASNPIVVWGDGGGIGSNRWWSNDSVDSTATITCGGYYLYMYLDYYWHIHNVDWIEHTLYGMRPYASSGMLITDCEFSGTGIGVYPGIGGISRIVNCTFIGSSNSGEGIRSYGNLIVENSTFDDLDKAIITIYSGWFFNCDFGQTTANTYDAFSESDRSYIRIIGGQFNNNSGLFVTNTAHYRGLAQINRYYINETKRPMFFSEQGFFDMITDYGIVHSGGGDYSIKITTASDCGLMKPAAPIRLAVYADSLENRNYTISAYRNAAWGSAPTAAELYLEISYWDADSLTTLASTQVLTNADTWYDLTVSDISPNHDGAIICTVWLKAYDSDGAIYLDPRLVATGETYHETINWGLPDLAFLYTEEEDEAAYDVLYQLRHHMQIKGEGKTWQRP